ncbi:hypothetical protein EJB05_14480, partial [Eragrostis curvula]
MGSNQFIVTSLLDRLIPEVKCGQSMHLLLVFLWTGLVVVIGINASVAVPGDPREGRNANPSMDLLIKALWIAYLTLSTPGVPPSLILLHLFIIMFIKLIFKYSTFYKARKAFEFGRNPRLIAGHMAQLQQKLGDESQSPAPPALVVMGEGNVQVEKQHQGYSFRGMAEPDDKGDTGREKSIKKLVTLDKVWQLNDIGMLQKSVIRPKDLCLSFALFKLLRCRFARYTVVEAGYMKADKFFRGTLLQGADYSRVFRVIVDELCFIHDYYYSSFPIVYSHHLLPILHIAFKIYVIGYCLCLIAAIFALGLLLPEASQIKCDAPCSEGTDSYSFELGALTSDLVPTFIVLAVLVLSEARDISFYICSNWTKVALLYHHVNRACWQRPLFVQKCIAWMLMHRRCKLVNNNWGEKMSQCSVLGLHPRRIPIPQCLRNRRKTVKVPNAVKAAIFESLKQEDLTSEQVGGLKHIRPPSSPISASPTVEIGGGSLWACAGKRPAYTILVWHVATSIFEARHPKPSESEDHMVAAAHLSRYCAYMVSYCPELLPDDDEWCKSIYKDVKKDADRVLSMAPGGEYQHLAQSLSAESNHEVLKDGARLGNQLVDSKIGWEALARFWSEMILYVAPSENLDGHAEAIARGGELITLLWALLAHAGIVGRLDDADETAAATDADRV